MRQPVLTSVAALVLSIALAYPCVAQQGSLIGIVADESKSVLPGVSVTVTNLATGVQVTAVTDERGEYRLPRLEAGRYKIQTEIAGFASALIESVEVLVGQNLTLPFTM